MKQLRQFITEKFKINSKNISKQYNYHPKTNEELIQTIYRLINKRGNEADLNDIDTSEITDMESVFDDNDIVRNFNGDISEWDVSNVESMSDMFNGSKFNRDISNWDVKNVKYMLNMFRNSDFNQDVSKWDVSNVMTLANMFAYSKFNGDLSNWNIKKNADQTWMVKKCPMERDKSKWPKSWLK